MTLADPPLTSPSSDSTTVRAMDDRTEGVTLFNGFISDVLDCFADEQAQHPQLAKLGAPYLGLPPDHLSSMQAYNDICDWIEDHLGAAAIIQAGVVIGERVVNFSRAQNMLSDITTPIEMMRHLQMMATQMIQDPHGRGWEIFDVHDNNLFMRRTQTFNCMLQQGLLTGLLRHTTARFPLCRKTACTRLGHAFCEYEVRWQK